MKYEVQIERTIKEYATITVDALNKADAVYLANMHREELEYDTTDADYDFEVELK